MHVEEPDSMKGTSSFHESVVVRIHTHLCSCQQMHAYIGTNVRKDMGGGERGRAQSVSACLIMSFSRVWYDVLDPSYGTAHVQV